jgi:hypothetical protein
MCFYLRTYFSNWNSWWTFRTHLWYIQIYFYYIFLVFLTGLIKAISSAILGGAVVLGMSTFFSVILALVFIFCLKKNDVDSNANEQQSHQHRRQHKQTRHSNQNQNQNRPVKREQRFPQEVVVISGANRSDQQRRSNVYDKQMYSPPIHTSELTNGTNAGYGRQMPPSSVNTSISGYLNQSNGTINHQQPMNANDRRSTYNRH